MSVSLYAAVPSDFAAWQQSVERRLRAIATTAMSRPSLEVTSGNFNVRGGGSIFVYEGGSVASTYNGSRADLFRGGLWLRSTPDVQWGRIGTDAGSGSTELEIVPPRTSGEESGNYLVWTGAVPGTAGLVSWQVAGVEVFQATPTDLVLGDPARTVWLEGNQIRMNGVTNTSSAANMRLDGGRVYLSTSSRRYKRNVKPAGIDPDAVLSLEPKTWRDRNDVAENGDDARWHAGLIAEEVHDAGLGQFVDYDDEGRPDALQYDRLGTAGLLTVARRQHEQITDLQTENANLTARLARLEAHLGLQEPTGGATTTSPAQEATP